LSTDPLFGNWMVAVAEAAAVAGAPELDDATADQMTRAWGLVRKTADVSLGELTTGIAEQAHVPVADLANADTRAAGLVPAEVAHRRNVLPLDCTGKEITIATANPLSQDAKREIASLTGRVVAFQIAAPNEIASAIRSQYGAAAIAQPRAEADIKSTPAPAGPHVLVVDDEVGQRALFRSVLEEAGYRVSVAVDGPEAIELLEGDEQYDLVTLDYWMQRMNGLRVLQHIRDQASTALVPVIMVTGADDRQIEMSLFEAGADDYVGKPIDGPLFILRVQAVLRLHPPGAGGTSSTRVRAISEVVADSLPSRSMSFRTTPDHVTHARILLLLTLMVGRALAPQVVSAQESQQIAVAHPIENAPTVDGVLDEAFWATIPPITGFLQRDPVDGAPASERTEVRIAYTPTAFYFGMTMYDSEPDLILGNILQRGGWIDKDDNVRIAIDTYNDGRNAYLFEIGSLGAQDDALISDEGSEDWNCDGIYTTESRVTDEGWVLEVEIPFTTIRFDDPTAPEMGIAMFRSIRRKNESVYWPHIGQEYRSGIRTVSRYASLTGLQDLQKGRHIEVKPYGIAGATSTPDDGTDTEIDAGLDVKASIASNFTLDLTYNTDFAQVEADNVQINLTRFSLFFPEKREFFLERANLFKLGASQEAEVFFSRQVGLDSDILGGGRLTGQVGPISVGTMSLRTESALPEGVTDPNDPAAVPAAWNSVARVRGDLMPRTTLGGIITSQESDFGHNRVAGADLEARFWTSSSLLLWGANVWDSDYQDGDGESYAGQAELILQNDLYVAEITRTVIGEAFDPSLGFVRRSDQKRWGGRLGYRPRFEQSTWARQLFLTVGANHIDGIDGMKQSHFRSFSTNLFFQSGDNTTADVAERFEHLDDPAFINGREIPPGDYTFRTVSANFRPNRARALGVRFNASYGGFWSGTRTAVGGGFVWIANKHLTIDTNASWNDVSLPVPDGDFSTALVSTRFEAALNRQLFANALVQWDDVSNTLQSNIRIDWIHTPGSDLFVVFDTGYLTGALDDPRDPRWIRRTGVVKLTYLKAF